ncbi:MAG: hypothetical protein NZ602_12135 [Thermoguttaceae bacterium]|nr:hypothetical protein [Thermoguttaceae bacterium]MDW8038998.1 hypothetical protein [Thermoguttaceae bacterium]
MDDVVAIDFGTMRTKLAYVDLRPQRPELMHLGQEERPYIPSLFYLGEDGRRLFGEEAALELTRDPMGFLLQPLKRQLRELWVRAANRQKATPEELLGLLLAGLRQRCREIARFHRNLPNGLVLTIPCQYGPPDRKVLKSAACRAGFAEDRIEFIERSRLLPHRHG